MKMGPLTIQFHRTVRVAEGRVPAALPPSLGTIQTFEVKKYRDRCPAIWEDEGIFIGLHDTEALWFSCHSHTPVALMVGAGSINAVNGQPLTTRLETGGYMVVPPQPWLDGWKADDGSVYQFVATPYQKGEGKTVAEQLIGDKSKTGGLGFALFEAKDPSKLMIPKATYPAQTTGVGPYDEMSTTMCYTAGPVGSAGIPMASPGDFEESGYVKTMTSSAPVSKGGQHVNSSYVTRGVRGQSTAFTEMGLGKGGKITQKVYEDPYGLGTWKELPSQTRAIYIVNATLLQEITGVTIPTPAAQETFSGPWFGLQDSGVKDVKGSEKFTGLTSVFHDEPEPNESAVFADKKAE